MDETLIVAENIHKIYNTKNKVHALRGIDLAVKRAEILAIYGPSGAGKSTLLHILSGLDTPDKGRVVFKGIDIAALEDSKRARLINGSIGFVFQFYHLLDEFSALENIMLPALLKRDAGKKRVRDKAEYILNKVGLNNRANHSPSELSGGEKQRVAICRALINNPAVIFCDEPTGNLDSKTSSHIHDLLWEVSRKEGTTVILVTHEKTLIEGSDRTLKIRDGMLEE